jgi:hypothetical protein
MDISYIFNKLTITKLVLLDLRNKFASFRIKSDGGFFSYSADRLPPFGEELFCGDNSSRMSLRKCSVRSRS